MQLASEVVDEAWGTLARTTIDYGFFGLPGDLHPDAIGGNKLPVLVVRERLSKCTWAHPVPSKGVEHPHGSAKLLEDLNETGYRRVMLKSDQEPAIRALCDAVKNGFRGEVVPEKAPKENHEKSIGEAENAVQQVHGMARTLKEHIEINAGIEIQAKHPILAWLVTFAATALTLFAKGSDGMTGYQRLRGKPGRVPLPAFAERIEYRRRTRHKLESRWRPGIFLGVKRDTTEKIVGDEEGTYVVQSVRRVPKEQQWDGELILKIRGTPWNPTPSSEREELPQPITLEPELPDEPKEKSQAYDRETAMRYFCITKADLEAQGYTAGCPACDETRLGQRTPGVKHTSLCRARIEEALAGTDRFQRTQERVNQRIAERVQKDDEDRKRRAENKESVQRSSRQRTVSVPAGSSEPATRDVLVPAVQSAGSGAKRKAPDDTEAEDGMETTCLYGPGDDDEEYINLLVEKVHDGQVISIVEAATQEANPMPTCDEVDPMDIDSSWDYFVDNVSGKYLDPRLVAQARKEEIDVIDEMKVWIRVPRPTDKPVLKGRWVDIDKGDADEPNYRSRYVAKDINKGPKSRVIAQYFAAMPTLSSFKFLLVLAVTDMILDLSGRWTTRQYQAVIGFLDVSRAHFVSKATRELYLELPDEAKVAGRDLVAFLLNSFYGTRDAGHNWDIEKVRVLVSELSFVQDPGNVCNFVHFERDLRVSVHGDDFTTLGSFQQVQWFHAEIQKHWKCKDRGIFGPPGTKGTIQEMRHLNRLLTWTREGITYEADPRHVEIVLNTVGTEGAKVTTPLVRHKLEDIDDTPVAEDEAGAYRSNAMRVGYLAQDRTDLQRAVRELAKGLKAPTVHNVQCLKRVARYFRHAPRVVQHFRYQRRLKQLDCHADTDHAGCVRTRKSTTGGVMMAGSSQLRSFCRGQSVIALSSGEAEYYGLVTMACEAIGEQAMARGFGVRLPIKIWLDATAGAAIGSRRGLGKVKHIHTIFLWVQDKVANKELDIGKVHTSQNLADILTKPVDAALIERMMTEMSFTYEDGRSSLALKA